jgi:PAP2 superfamily
MLSWQQAAMLAAGLVAAGLLLVRLAKSGQEPGRPAGRATRWAAHIGPFAREAGVVTALYALWQLAGNLAVGGLSEALTHAWWIWHTERSLGLPSELSVQRLLLPHPLLSQLANLYYATMHFGVLIAMLVWLFIRHRDAYPAVRNAMAASTAICLLVSFIPVAPPRMLTSLGFVDLAARYGESVYGAARTAGVAGANVGADQLSAMPSVHVCWSVLVAWAVITASTSRWRWLILAHPVVTVFVVVGTGNHYWSDGIVSVAIVAVVLAVQALLRAKLAGFRRAAPQSRPAPAVPAAPAAPLPTGAASVAEGMGEKESSQPLGSCPR